MSLSIQIFLSIFSIVFGFFYCISFIFYKKNIRRFKYNFIIDFLFNFLFLILFILIIYHVNYLFLNYYILLLFFIGFIVAYLTVNHY